MFSTGETLGIVVASVSYTFSSLKLGFSVVYQLAIASTMLENKCPRKLLHRNESVLWLRSLCWAGSQIAQIGLLSFCLIEHFY